MEKPSDGLGMIRSRGLSVFVMDREIKLEGDQWRNEIGLFDELEEAVKSLLKLEVKALAPKGLENIDVKIELVGKK